MGKQPHVHYQQECDQNKNASATQNNKKKKSGRPPNIQMESMFMNVIRGTKLQVLHAEAELELQMTFFTPEEHKNKKNRRNQQQQIVQQKNVTKKIFQFSSLSSQQKQQISKVFEEDRTKWKFNEIQKQEDIPEYFFSEGEDLAFIMYQIICGKKFKSKFELKRQKQTKYQIKKVYNLSLRPQELFFLCLICLNAKQNLRFEVVQFFLKNQILIINLLKHSLSKIKERYLQKIEQKKQEEEREKQLAQIRANRYHFYNTIEQSIIYQDSSVLRQKMMNSKKIQKSSKSVKRQNKKYEDSKSEQEIQRTQQEKQEKLIYCLISYICWSYLYIYKEEEELEKMLSDQELSEKKEQ